MLPDIRICFIGDSLVNGTGDPESLGWAGRLCAFANQRGSQITYYNLGIRRNTTRDVLERLEKECALRLPEICDSRVVISCGINDTVIENGKVRISPDESIANIRDILLASAKYKSIFVGPPPLIDKDQNERIKNLSNSFKLESNRLGIPFIDTFSALITDNAYKAEIFGNDGAHPKSGGYIKIANIIQNSPLWWFYKPTDVPGE